MPTNFDFNLFEEMVSNAPSAGYGPRVNYGKLTMDVAVVYWDKNAGKFITHDWDGKTPLNRDRREYFQLTFKSNLGELNPAFDAEYKRRVDVKVSDKNGKKPTLTDWSETVEPALKKTMGNNYGKLLARGIWAEWEDAETVETDKEGRLKGFVRKDRNTGEPVIDEAGNEIRLTNSVPRVLRTFKSKAEAEAARAERYGSGNDDFPGAGNVSDIPESVAKDVKGLFQALEYDEALEMLKDNEDYSQYDLDALLSAAGVTKE